MQPPTESVNNRPSVLGIHQSAGVSKKTRRGRKAVLSTKARRRHERGLERAEEIVDRTALKVQKSRRAAAETASRKRAWDDVNGAIGGAAAGAAGARAGLNMFAGLQQDEGGDHDDDVEEVDEFDDEMGDAAAATAAVPAPAAAPPPEDEDEVIL